jgi:hypothetical protein
MSNSGSEEQDLLASNDGPAAAVTEDAQDRKTEETLTPGIDIASAKESITDNIGRLELGDTVEIISERYGSVEGRIYYRDNELIRVLPIGASDILYDFPIDQDTGKIEEDIGVTDIPKLVKRYLNTFVEQNNLHQGQLVETFTTTREQGPKYIITGVNTGADKAIFREINSGEEVPIEFNGVGIPRRYPFIILRTREAPDSEGSASSEAPSENTIGPTGPLSNEEMFEEDDIDEDGFATVEVKLVSFVNVPIIEEAEELAEIARRYPESLQKSDLLSDFISLLSARDQKDSRKLQQIRSAVEQYSLLKNAILDYDAQGQPLARPKPTSYMMMADLLESENVPLQRPVVDIKKRVYFTTRELQKPGSEGEEIADELKDDQFIIKNAEAKKEEQSSFFPPDEFKKAGTSAPSGEPLDANFYNNIIRYLNKFQTPYESGSTAGKDLFIPKADSEVFRLEAPATDEEDTSLKGVHLDCHVFKGIKTCEPLAEKILFSTERILTSTYRPTVGGRPKQVLTSAETLP